MIIDFHTHAFPDKLADSAIAKLTYPSKIKPFFDGTVSGLLKSMDEAGIEKSVVLNIATKPSQTENIIKWCKEIKGERIIPFASIHPDNKKAGDLIKKISGEGLPGIKLHPMYQNFYLDDEKMLFIYEEIVKNNLILLFHIGFDIAFPDDRKAEIRRLKKVVQKFPELKIIAAHTGGWRMWDEVLQDIAGFDIWFETSMTLKYIEDRKIFLEILKKHPSDKIMFGTDAPWTNQKEEVKLMRDIRDISEDLKEKIFSGNAKKLLDLQ
ncbi:MAG: amidohydrolase family protein [Elusimicrobiota bacterium]|nr:amidohydrolase family protein [Elusimicrobiota bacterium]